MREGLKVHVGAIAISVKDKGKIKKLLYLVIKPVEARRRKYWHISTLQYSVTSG